MTLLPPQVRAIRAALANGDSYTTIARAHGTIALVVANIHRGRAYKSVGLDEKPARIDPERESALKQVANWNANRRKEDWPRFHRTLEQIEALLERQAA